MEFKLVKEGWIHFQQMLERSKLPARKCGALMLAWNEEELKYVSVDQPKLIFLSKLSEVVAKSHDNGVLDVKILSRDQILSLEPNIDSSVLGGLVIPGETAVGKSGLFVN